MKRKKVTFERIAKVYASGSEQEAERLAYDILFEDIGDVIKAQRFIMGL